ncbi:hypothetical protein DMUE_3510 [Dictyocoela muelleri]|nr:hypothetical protein DMUE_3510 [Dictyocoela muelleri]
MILQILDDIFMDMSKLFDFIVENNIMTRHIICEACGRNSVLKKMIRKSKCIIIYRCEFVSCRKIKSTTNSKIELTKLIHIIYLILNNSTYKQINIYHGIADTTINNIKKRMRKCFEAYCTKRPVFIGGLGKTVEADETVLSRRGIIRYPTSTDDDVKDTVWILGVIDSVDKNQFFLKRVINRQINTLTDALIGKIGVCSKLNTDGYPSYPGVADNLCLEHEVVNHSEGFISLNGTHTNNIEGFWSHLKSSMRKEHGVMRKNIDSWLLEYTFRRRYLMNANGEEFFEVFKEIIKYYFN